MTPTKIEEMLLANFVDGASWEEADAATFTKYGARDIANFFAEAGHAAAMEEVREIIDARCDELVKDKYNSEVIRIGSAELLLLKSALTRLDNK